MGSNPTLAAPSRGGSTLSAVPSAEQRFRLSARPPVRALAISSVAALIGSVLLVVTVPAQWPEWVMVLGGVVMGLGVALAAVALIATRRLRTVLLLDESGVRILRTGRARTLAWSEIENVTLRGPRLLFNLRSGRSVAVVNPPGSPPAVFDALVAAVQQRLDADRGYRGLG